MDLLLALLAVPLLVVPLLVLVPPPSQLGKYFVQYNHSFIDAGIFIARSVALTLPPALRWPTSPPPPTPSD
jgi:hypothetical protein